jgi:hypothetical protein
MNEIVLIQKVLRYLFYGLVIATAICWALSHYKGVDDQYWLYCGMGAIGCSLLRFVLRFIL